MNRMKKAYRILILFFILIGFDSVSAQQNPGINVQIDTTQIRIGEQIKVSVLAQTDTLSFVDFLELKELGNFEVVKASLPDTLEKSPDRKLLKNYYITAWDTGKYSMPPIKITIQDSIFTTDSIPGIEVLGVKLDTINQPAYGYKEIINAEGEKAGDYHQKTFSYWWFLLLLLLPLAYYLYKRRHKIFSKTKVLSPYEKAVSGWEKLKNEALWKRGETGKHYFRLTHLLKNYIEEDLHLSAKEKISSELLQELKKYRFENGEYFSPVLLEKLQKTLQRADLAKYANLSPSSPEIDEDMQVIKDLIDQSHQVLSVIEEEKARKQAEIEQAKRRKRKILYISLSVILAIALLIGGTTYYFLNKYGVLDQVQENIYAPEWVYNEYGGNPAMGLTTPHVLSPYEIKQKLSDAEKMALDKLPGEISVYTDQNFLKGYAIVEMNVDLDKPLPQQVDLGPEMLNLLLKALKVKDPKMEKDQAEEGMFYKGEFEMEIPTLKLMRKFDFEARTFSGPNYARLVLVAYKKGSEENKKLAGKVIQSAELIKE